MSEMQLHEAIRLGAMLKPQQRGWLVIHGRTCAIGSALDAVGVIDRHVKGDIAYARLYEIADQQFPILGADVPDALAPIPGCRGRCVADAIQDLNDYHGWTREAIADWVEQIEGQATPVESDQSAALTAGGCTRAGVVRTPREV